MTENAASGLPTPQGRDAYMIVRQNNEKKSVKIIEASEELAQAIGYTRSELEGTTLETYLGRKATETVEELLEYDDFAMDLDDILKRIPGFKLKHFNGSEIPFALKVYRDEARDMHQWFRINLQDERRQIEDGSLLAMVKQNVEGFRSIDETTGLPDAHSAETYLELIQKYVQSHELNACLAVLRMDRYEKTIARYGVNPCLELIKHLGTVCKARFRAEDLVCQLSNTMIALILIDIEEETARVVLNRLRWHIASQRITFGGKADFSVTASLAYSPLRPDEERDLLGLCQERLEEVDSEERNAMIDLSAA